MSIRIGEQERLFSLETEHTLYQMKADETGVLLHLWYGPRTGADMGYRIRTVNRGFCGNPYEAQERLDYSLDTLPQEYSGNGVGDYRSAAVQAEHRSGSMSVDWRYAGYRLLKGKEKPAGLPGVRGNADTEGLEIILEDKAGGLAAYLAYWVFAEYDIPNINPICQNSFYCFDLPWIASSCSESSLIQFFRNLCNRRALYKAIKHIPHIVRIFVFCKRITIAVVSIVSSRHRIEPAFSDFVPVCPFQVF